jgi:hypothetical protein
VPVINQAISEIGGYVTVIFIFFQFLAGMICGPIEKINLAQSIKDIGKIKLPKIEWHHYFTFVLYKRILICPCIKQSKDIEEIDLANEKVEQITSIQRLAQLDLVFDEYSDSPPPGGHKYSIVDQQ